MAHARDWIVVAGAGIAAAALTAVKHLRTAPVSSKRSTAPRQNGTTSIRPSSLGGGRNYDVRRSPEAMSVRFYVGPFTVSMIAGRGAYYRPGEAVEIGLLRGRELIHPTEIGLRGYDEYWERKASPVGVRVPYREAAQLIQDVETVVDQRARPANDASKLFLLGAYREAKGRPSRR